MRMKEKIIQWQYTGEVGASSQTMAWFFAGETMTQDQINHPYDPADFNRCRKFLLEVPEARPRLRELGALSLEWAALVDRWDEIERSFWDEVAASLDSGRPRWTAPKTYALMKEVLGEEAPTSARGEGEDVNRP